MFSIDRWDDIWDKEIDGRECAYEELEEPMNRSDLPGVHHMYLGLFLELVGFLFIWVTLWVAIPLLIIGQWLILDDTYQHIRKRKHPKYQSPIHKLFGLIYKWKWIQKVTEFFDGIFGREAK